MSGSASGSPIKLGSLEVGRAVAAIMVVMHHASMSANDFTRGGSYHFIEWGFYGVDFFFVLSGFIIYHVHHRDPRTLIAARRYLGRRLRRIYTPYLPISVLMMAGYMLLPGLSEGVRDWSVFTSLTLLPSDGPPALSVAWTLVYEMIFYIFFLSFYATRLFWFGVASWTVVVLAVAAFGVNKELGPVLGTVTNLLVLEFIGGMLAAHLFAKAVGELWPMLIGLSIAALLAIALLLPEAHRVLVGLALVPMVLGLAQVERRVSFPVPRAFLLLGAASYAIYLVHNPLFSILGRVLRGLDNWVLTFAACTLAGIAAGLAWHFFYERPALRLLNPRQSAFLDLRRESSSHGFFQK